MNSKQKRDIYQPEFFKLLSDCYILPDTHLKDSVVALNYLVKKAYPQLENEADMMLDSLEGVDDLESLQIDFTKLFIGPYTMLAPPYESIYRKGEGAMMGESTMDVLQLYKESGLDLAGGYNDAPDHIATELEFLYVLFAKAFSQGIFSDDREESNTEEILKVLLTEHLSQWIPDLTQRMENHAESSFYKALAKITKESVLREAENYLAA